MNICEVLLMAELLIQLRSQRDRTVKRGKYYSSEEMQVKSQIIV